LGDYFARWLFAAIVTDPDVSWRTTLPGRWDIGFLVPVDAFKRPSIPPTGVSFTSCQRSSSR
jgi:hypothetical protein